MKLYEAIAYTIQKEGIEIIGKPQFVNYLADLQAYEIPAVKRIVRAIVHEGYSLKLQEALQNNANELAYNDVLYQLTHFAEFQEEMVRFVLNSLLYANDKISQEPSFEYNVPAADLPASIVVESKPVSIVSKKAIEDFFDYEAEAAKARWEATMNLSLKDRIRKRKAIKDVYLDKDFSSTSDEDYILLKLSVGVNLSDFKEGECLSLHKEDSMYGIKGRLNAFQDDHTIILEVYPPSMPSDIQSYHDIPLVLDKDKVDLRQYVFCPFLDQLPSDRKSFWKTLILNSCPKPTFKNSTRCKKKLEETIKEFDLSLLPKQEEAILKSMEAKDYYLIQGPPGTGKSYVISIIMFEEMCDLNHNVIVIGPNHMAINNALGQLLKILPKNSGLILKVGQSYNAPTIKVENEEGEDGIYNVTHLNVPAALAFNSKHDVYWCIGLTPHCLYTSRARGLECDTLIIDEAGQMTIPLALMGMIKAKKVIFAGDHKQLPPIVSSDQIQPELRQSVFQALISDDNCTMLDTSFRMCKPICDYVSELFYDGILKSIKSGCGDALICEDPLYSFDHPVILHEVMDDGEQVSDKEAGFIADTVAGLIERGINAEEIGVLAPFRAQAATIRRAIRKHKGIKAEDAKKITSDTVDKMQGQEREVILYSLVSGNIDYMTEMAEFLYNPNKMNVAFSRAKSKLIIVGSLKKIANLVLPQYPHISKMLNSKHALKI